MSKKAQRDVYNLMEKAYIDATGIKEGSKVRITATAESHQNGWWNWWNPRMTETVGMVGTVQGINGQGTGIGVIVPGYAQYYYPYFVVEKLEETPSVAVYLNHAYNAIISSEGVKVGCSLFSFDTVERLSKEVQNYRATHKL